jgi:hypothetical protein
MAVLENVTYRLFIHPLERSVKVIRMIKQLSIKTDDPLPIKTLPPCVQEPQDEGNEIH